MCDHEASETVQTVYQLREAAVNHGRALAAADLIPSPTTRDRVLDTKLELEERTVAAIEVCSDEPGLPSDRNGENGSGGRAAA